MPDLPREVLEDMRRNSETLGRIEANQEHTLGYITKVDKKLDEHMLDTGAHGLRVEKEEQRKAEEASSRTWSNLPNWILALIALATILGHWAVEMVAHAASKK